MMKAIRTVAGHKAELQEVPVPSLRADHILVKVKAVALNPSDWSDALQYPLFPPINGVRYQDVR